MDLDINDSINIYYIMSLILLIFIIGAIVYYLFFYKKPTGNQNFETRHNNKVETFKAKVHLLEEKINNIIVNETPDISNIDKEKELFELYYKGVPDTYDLNGRLIRGVEPDALKAINYLNLIIKSPYGSEKDILSLARIYHYGMHMFERNLDKAEEIYNGLKFDNISLETRTTIKEALLDIQKIRVYTWLNLPLERPILNPDFESRDDEVREIREVREINNERRPHRNPVIIQPIVNLPEYPIRNQVKTTVDSKNYNDPQNTHNPQVLSTIRHSLNNLKINTPVEKDTIISTTEIKTYIDSLPDSDKKEDALKSLRVIETNPDKLSSTDMTEIDALTLVWNRIHDSNKFNKEIRDNLKETLFDELASMQEYGVTICSTGRFTHIIDTLNGVDEEVSIKPFYAINEEMMLTASNIREKMYQEQTLEERKLLEAGTSLNQEEFDSKLRKTILDKLKEDYVKTGILSNEKFTLTTDIWINEI